MKLVLHNLCTVVAPGCPVVVIEMSAKSCHDDLEKDVSILPRNLHWLHVADECPFFNLGRARNMGVRFARESLGAEWFLLWDCDCVATPSMIRSVWKTHVECDPAASAVGIARILRVGQDTRDDALIHFDLPADIVKSPVFTGRGPFGGASFISWAAMEEVRGFPELTGWGAEDDIFRIKLTTVNNVRVWDSSPPSVFHLWHPYTTSHKSDRKPNYAEHYSWYTAWKTHGVTEVRRMITNCKTDWGVGVIAAHFCHPVLTDAGPLALGDGTERVTDASSGLPGPALECRRKVAVAISSLECLNGAKMQTCVFRLTVFVLLDENDPVSFWQSVKASALKWLSEQASVSGGILVISRSKSDWRVVAADIAAHLPPIPVAMFTPDTTEDAVLAAALCRRGGVCCAASELSLACAYRCQSEGPSATGGVYPTFAFHAAVLDGDQAVFVSDWLTTPFPPRPLTVHTLAATAQ